MYVYKITISHFLSYPFGSTRLIKSQLEKHKLEKKIKRIKRLLILLSWNDGIKKSSSYGYDNFMPEKIFEILSRMYYIKPFIERIDNIENININW